MVMQGPENPRLVRLASTAELITDDLDQLTDPERDVARAAEAGRAGHAAVAVATAERDTAEPRG